MKTSRTIPANQGLMSEYYLKLKKEIDNMLEQFSPDWLDGTKYGEYLAYKEFAANWVKIFDDLSISLSKDFVEKGVKLTDQMIKKSLADAGWTVKFQVTEKMQKTIENNINEQVSLIKSIPEQFLERVETIITKSFVAGFDLKQAVDDLTEVTGITRDRAKLIARDQTSKLHAVVSQARLEEIGIKQAVWMHSHAGKKPRPDHVAAHGAIYKVSEGCLISGEYILPGELINCRCSYKPVLPI